MNKLIVPKEFYDADIKKLQTALNELSGNGKLYQKIKVTGLYDIYTESALVNALEKVGRKNILSSMSDKKQSVKGDK